MGRRSKRPYRIIGAYDSETCNINNRDGIFAYPILHQLGLIDIPIEDIDADNVEKHTTMHLCRHSFELHAILDDLVENTFDFVPVICCHNLSFDMYGLSSWLDSYENVRVLAKSCRKPITFTICDDENNPKLVLWDTLVFSGQSLSRMGDDCGYPKAVGDWDYNLIRTPETELSDEEIYYATHDVYALLAWLGWWLRRNPDIQPEKLGLNVVTKTGVVRERRKVRFSNLHGKGLKLSLGRYWFFLNQQEQPKTDDELFCMFAATRGGLTFCASEHASVVYNLENTDFRIYAFDATSQHPAQMVSHAYPIRFEKATPLALQNVFKKIKRLSLGHVLRHWDKPFDSAIYACYEFTNIRPKAGSLYEEHGILPLASARFINPDYELNEDNQDNQEFQSANPYKDTAENPVFLFGKLVSADKAKVYVTELALWEICLAYDFDSCEALSGYITGRFIKPSDMSVISVMQFYKAKNLYKDARSEYYKNGRIEDSTARTLETVNIPDSIIKGMLSGTLPDTETDATYQGLKADLNALYGIECSNEYRRDTVLSHYGIEYQGEFGIVNAPKNSKAWYQFGQRIVGWSRIAQHAVMQLAQPIALDIINGDTDSIKLCVHKDQFGDLCKRLDILGRAIDYGKKRICRRVRRCYPEFYDELENIGHYVFEFETDRFCASWNKAYVLQDASRDGKRHFSFTLAGIPAKRGLNQLADRLYEDGTSFEDICRVVLGYNATIAYDLIRLHARRFPEWGEIVFADVTDYNGVISRVSECAALALYPMSKIINNTRNMENYHNCLQAIKNDPDINDEPVLITERGFIWL